MKPKTESPNLAEARTGRRGEFRGKTGGVLWGVAGWLWLGLACGLMGAIGVRGAEGSETSAVDFNREIRPILSQNCFFCHGPDEGERKGGERSRGGLRLDTQAGQRERHGDRVAVVPGKPDTSEILRRLETADADDVMPPVKSGKRLTPEEVGLVRRWIAEGARFSNHWSYEKPVRPALPEVRDSAWPRQGLDRFILARLEREGLAPQPEAERSVLARRVALDLTGLPPTVEELDTFLADGSEDAYERYVEQQLSKAAYGEHWARMWLDLARYADSAGYADDPPRTIWPYRDYVIRAFNENLPFDRFTVEQLAGDLLPEPTEEQLKATAFHRNTMTNSEGGTNDEEFRNVAVVDRLNTTFAVWMGTSMACAQCHTHKYDPISQREYFQLFAFLNNTADADRPDEAPLMEFDSEDVRRRRAAIETEFGMLDARFRAAAPDLAGASESWARLFPTSLDWRTPAPVGVKSEKGHRLTIEADHRVRVMVETNRSLEDSFTVELPFDVASTLTGLRIETWVDGKPGGTGGGGAGGFRLRSVRAKVLPVPNQAGPEMRFVRVELPRLGALRLAEVQVFGNGENVALGRPARQSSVSGDAEAGRAVDGRAAVRGPEAVAAVTREEEKPWFEIDLGSVRPVERIVIWPAVGPGVRMEGYRVVGLNGERQVVWEKAANPEPKQEAGFDLIGPREVEFVNASGDTNEPGLDEALVATDSPRSSRYRVRREKGWGVGTGEHVLFVTTGKPVEIPRGATLSVVLSHGGGGRGLPAGYRVGVTGDSRVGEYVDTPPGVREAVSEDPARWDGERRGKVLDYFTREVAAGLREERERYARLRKERDELKPLTVPVLRELGEKERRTTKIQLRGNFLITTEEVTAGVPAAWHGLPAGAPRDRLTLARWLVSEENPLTARVVANRFWEQIFGLGIVRTSEEFGSQGELPVHPELLDWLATELQGNGWDVKRFLRLLVTSAAYRQTSRVTPAALEKDPENRWVSRGPRFRLSAEAIRDQALAVAGLLSAKMMGPSVRPARPSLDLRAAFGGNLDWQTSAGEDSYRRGLYTEWRRTSPYPSMATFDAPSREVCTLRRNRSNTPLQALVTLNDPVYVEAARALARRMIAAGDGLEPRLRRGFRLVLAREPSVAETGEVRALLEDVTARLSGSRERAEALAGVGPGAAGAAGVGVSSVEMASWTAVANVLLNLDEALMKR